MPGLANTLFAHLHAGQRPVQYQAVARRLAQADVVMFVGLCPGHRVLLGQRVVLAAGDDIAFFKQVAELDLRCEIAREAQAEVRFAGGHGGTHFVGRGVVQVDAHFRILPVEGTNGVGHEVVGG